MEKYRNNKKNHKNHEGFSMVEVLIVIGIMGVLLAVAFPSLTGLRLNLRQKELDAKAEIIYIAAQNQLVKLWASGNEDVYKNYTDDFEAFRLVHTDEPQPGKDKKPPSIEYTDSSEEYQDPIDLYYFTSNSDDISVDIGRRVMVAGSMDDMLDQHYWVVEFDRRSGGVYAVFYSQVENIAAESNCNGYAQNWSRFNSLRNYDKRLKEGAKVGYYDGNMTNNDMPPGYDEIYNLDAYLTIKNKEELIVRLTCRNVPENKIDLSKLKFSLTLKEVDANGNDVGEYSFPDINGMETTRDQWGIYWKEITLDSLKSDSSRFNGNSGFIGLNPGVLHLKLECSYEGMLNRIIINSGVTNGYTSVLFAGDSTEDPKYFENLFANDMYNTAVIKYGRHLQNLDTKSGVKSNVTKAVQIENIDFLEDNTKKVNDNEYWYGVYQKSYFNGNEAKPGKPKFKPIENTNLQSYDGGGYSITGLYINDKKGDKNYQDASGLFLKADGKTLENINLVAATVKNSDGAAGALVGQVSGTDNEINKCGVYLEQDRDIKKAGKVKTSGDLAPWINGKVAGGLVGIVQRASDDLSGGKLDITESFASTVIGVQSTSNFAGGLVGQVQDADGDLLGGELILKQSYADSYIYGEQTGGLVAGGTVNEMINCYAAGFQNAKTKAAGLVNGKIQTAENSYTVSSMNSGASVTTYSTAWEIGENPKEIYYLFDGNTNLDGTEPIEEGANLNLGEQFQDCNDAKPYNYQGQSLDANYPYPRLTRNSHYGDWAAAFQSGSLVYYEQYNGSSYGFFGGNAFDSLRDDEYTAAGEEKYVVTGDGYGIAYLIDSDHPAPTNLRVKMPGYSDEFVTVPNYITIRSRGQVYRVYKLPADMMNAEPVKDENGNHAFYRKIEINAENANPSYYYFNPHFAKTSNRMKKSDDPIPTDINKSISVRTPRHTYSMSLYYDKYYRDATKGCTFEQERNINYTSYHWWDFYASRKDAENKIEKIPEDAEPWILDALKDNNTNHYVIDKQKPIGQTESTSFQAIYDGGCHIIRNISFATVNGDSVGMFGYNIGALKNIVLATDYEADNQDARRYLVRRENEIQNETVRMGVLAGYNGKDANIENCAVAGYYIAGSKGTIFALQGSTLYAGGLIGLNEGIIKNSAADFPMINLFTNFTSEARVGGFVGWNQSRVENCYAIGHIDADVRGRNVELGGFAAKNDGFISDCYCAVSSTSGGKSFDDSNNNSNNNEKDIKPHAFAPKGGQVSHCYYLDKGAFTFVHTLRNYNALSDLTDGASIMYSDLIKQRENWTYRARITDFRENTDKKETFYPFRAVVTGADGRYVHYGDWPLAPVMGSFGVFYWEHEINGNNNGYHFAYVGEEYDRQTDTFKNQTDNSLCYRHDDGGVISEFGYGVYVQKGWENQLTLETDTDGNITNSFAGNFADAPRNQQEQIEDFKKLFNKGAADSLEEQIQGFSFYPFTTPQTETKDEQGNYSLDLTGDGGYVYLSGQKGYGTWKLTLDNSMTFATVEYKIAPFFANAIQRLDASAPIQSIDKNSNQGYTRDYSALLGSESADNAGNPFEIRALAQLQYINWKYASGNETTGTAHSVVIGESVDSTPTTQLKNKETNTDLPPNYTEFPYLQYATLIEKGIQNRQSVEKKRPPQYWKQTHDLDGAGVTNYTPIAPLASASSGPDQHANCIFAWFGGGYDGRSYKIQNLNIISSAYSVGLFGVTVGASIQSIIMYGNGNTVARITDENKAEGIDIGPVKNSSGAYMIGGMIGVAFDYGTYNPNKDSKDSTISNCAIAGYEIIDKSESQQHNGGGNVGGLTGVACVNLTRCSAVVNIKIDCHHDQLNEKYRHAEFGSYIRVGGLTGAAQYRVTDCYSGGSIEVDKNTLNEFWGSEEKDESGKVIKRTGIRDKHTHIYVCGLSGSAFTSDFFNFTDYVGKEPDAKPIFKNCYTYTELPNYEGNIRGVCLLAGAADRYSKSGAKIYMANCYYLDSIKEDIEFSDIIYEFNSGYNHNAGEDKKRYLLTQKDRDAMLLGDLTINNYLINGHSKKEEDINKPDSKIPGDSTNYGDPLTGVTYEKLRDLMGDLNQYYASNNQSWNMVTTTEGNANIAGKYSFSGNSTEESKNYPFPTVIKQWDQTLGEFVNVHYGAWPSDGLYWDLGMGSVDIFSDLNQDSSYAEKSFVLRIRTSGEDAAERIKDIEISVGGQDDDKIAQAKTDDEGKILIEVANAENVEGFKPVPGFDSYLITFQALREGSASVTAILREKVDKENEENEETEDNEENEESEKPAISAEADFHLTVTANGLDLNSKIDGENSGDMILYQDDEDGKTIELYAQSVNGEDYTGLGNWNLNDPEERDSQDSEKDGALTLEQDETAKNQWKVTGANACARNLSAVFEYDYQKENGGQIISRTIPIHVRVLGDVGLTDGAAFSAYRRTKDRENLVRISNIHDDEKPSPPGGYALALYETLTDDMLNKLQVKNVTLTPIYKKDYHPKTSVECPYEVRFDQNITSSDKNFQYRGGEWRSKSDDDASWTEWDTAKIKTIRVDMDIYYGDAEAENAEIYHLSMNMTDVPTHKINFDANDGEESGKDDFTMPAIWSGVNQFVTLPECAYERTGYHFIGWWVGDDNPPAYNPAEADAIADKWEPGDEPCLVPAGGQIKSQGEIKIYAMWAANVYHVEFDPNGGGGSAEPWDMTYDQPRTLPEFDAPVFENITAPENTKFGGWNTSIDGTGESYKPGDEILNLTSENGETVTLYAQWKYGVTLKLWSYLNDELTEANQTGEFFVENGAFELGENYERFKNALKDANQKTDRKFLTFDGWYTYDGTQVLKADGTIASENITNYVIDGVFDFTGGDKTLYAKWVAKVYTRINKPTSENVVNYLPESQKEATGNYVIASPEQPDEEFVYALGVDTAKATTDSPGNSVGVRRFITGNDKASAAEKVSLYSLPDSVTLYDKIDDSVFQSDEAFISGVNSDSVWTVVCAEVIDKECHYSIKNQESGHFLWYPNNHYEFSLIKNPSARYLWRYGTFKRNGNNLDYYFESCGETDNKLMRGYAWTNTQNGFYREKNKWDSDNGVRFYREQTVYTFDMPDEPPEVTPEETATVTPTPQASVTPTPEPTATMTPEENLTPAPTVTPTAEPTPAPPVEPGATSETTADKNASLASFGDSEPYFTPWTVTITPTPEPTVIPEIVTVVPTPEPTVIPELVRTPTPTPEESAELTVTATPTPDENATPTPTPEPTVIPEIVITVTPTPEEQEESMELTATPAPDENATPTPTPEPTVIPEIVITSTPTPEW